MNAIFFIQTNVCIAFSLFFQWKSLHLENSYCFIMHVIHFFEEEYELKEAWISSNVRPLVSGTSFATNSTVKPLMAEKMKKVPGQT